jgi:Resolvase, N terminal domain
VNTNCFAAIYLCVSRGDQTTENQRLVLERVAQHHGWIIVQTYRGQGITGADRRDQRPAFDAMLKMPCGDGLTSCWSGSSTGSAAACCAWLTRLANSMLPTFGCIAINWVSTH